MTPEGKVKRAISKVLDKYKSIYRIMSVPGGYGASTLDYVLCFYGKFVAIEAKAPGKKPNPRQNAIIGAIKRAGGEVLVIDTEQGAQHLAALLSQIEVEACSPYK